MARSQVAIKRCDSYEPQEAQKAVGAAIELLGGIERFVKPGQRVLIKPNALSARPPESGVCTHPEVVRAVIRLVKKVTGNISVGDSHGGFDVVNMDSVYAASGIKDVCQKEGVNLVKFDTAVMIDDIPFAKAVKEADVIINLPKMKTHGLATITGAIKNIFGCVIGKYKAESHFRFVKTEDFCRHLVNIFSHVKPGLNIMDGIVAMEGDGPAAGALRNAGLVLASPDAVSLDAVFAAIAGLRPEDILTTLYASGMGLGVSRISDIEISGEQLESVKIADFKLPQASFIYNAPEWIIKIFGKLIRTYPFIEKKTCISCRICEKNCPVSAITIDRHNIDYSRCIYCFCCHELCPHSSVGVRKPLGGRLLNFMMEARRKWQSQR